MLRKPAPRTLVGLVALGLLSLVAQAGAVEPRETLDDSYMAPNPNPPDSGQALDLGAFHIVQVNVGAAGANILGDAGNEPSIAVDPTDPNHMAIGWRQFDNVSSNFRQAGWGYTGDGGRTWTFPGVLEPGVFRSDPVLDFDAAGNFYYSSLKSDFSVDIWKSTTQGVDWGTPIPAFGGDKQWVAIDRTGGQGHGNYYMAWSIAAGCCGDRTFTRSTDAVQSFQTPSLIPEQPAWGTMDVSPDGILYVSGHNFFSRTIYVSQSLDAQLAGPFNPTFNSIAVDLGGELDSGGPPNPGGLLGQAQVVSDHSGGPTHGNVYLLASVNPPGPDPLDVRFSRSTDNGLSWSTSVKVNDDPVGTNAYQWFATMSIAPNGRLDVIWNDTRNTGSNIMSELYYSSSTDAGVTWSTNQPLSPAWNSIIGHPNQDKIGDYYDMVSDNVGASLAWAATFNDEQDVYFTRIGDWDCNVNSVPDSLDISSGSSLDSNGNGIPDECEGITAIAVAPAPAQRALHQNTPNPFNPSTWIRFDLPQSASAPVKLVVYDVAGNQVRTLLDGPATSGEVRWDGRDDNGNAMASGPYFYTLDFGEQRETRKMVLLR